MRKKMKRNEEKEPSFKEKDDRRVTSIHRLILKRKGTQEKQDGDLASQRGCLMACTWALDASDCVTSSRACFDTRSREEVTSLSARGDDSMAAMITRERERERETDRQTETDTETKEV